MRPMNDSLAAPGADFADRRLLDLDPRPDPIAPALVRGREALTRSMQHLLSITDGSLEREWGWIGESESDVRSGFYLAVQSFERARGEIASSLAEAGDTPGPAWAAVAAATEARHDLHGLLAPLPDEVLDAAAGGGEWTLRETLAHIVESQRGYPYGSGWWLSRRDVTDFPQYVPDEVFAALPTDKAQGSGSLGDIRARLDALMDLGTALWQDMPADTLAVRARWSGFPVTLGFRLGNWAPHIEEHTVQIEKTLLMLGRSPSEVDRLVRLVHRAFGRMEAAAWGVPAEKIDGGAGSAIESAAAEVEQIAQEVATVARA